MDISKKDQIYLGQLCIYRHFMFVRQYGYEPKEWVGLPTHPQLMGACGRKPAEKYHPQSGWETVVMTIFWLSSVDQKTIHSRLPEGVVNGMGEGYRTYTIRCYPPNRGKNSCHEKHKKQKTMEQNISTVWQGSSHCLWKGLLVAWRSLIAGLGMFIRTLHTNGDVRSFSHGKRLKRNVGKLATLCCALSSGSNASIIKKKTKKSGSVSKGYKGSVRRWLKQLFQGHLNEKEMPS